MAHGHHDGTSPANPMAASDLLYYVEMQRQVRREFVRCGVRIADRPRHQAVPFKQRQVVSNGAIIERERVGQAVGVLRALGEPVEDAGPIRTAPSPNQEIPEKGTIGVGHRGGWAGGNISP
jgi:hypothetical protein